MIVTCPNCGARYRVPDESAGKRMRCAECQHRWVPDEEPFGLPEGGGLASSRAGGEDELPTAAIPAAMNAPTPGLPIAMDAPTPGPAGAESAPLPQAGGASQAQAVVDSDDDQPELRPRILTTLIAIIAGLGLAVAAAGLWMTDSMRAQLATVPGVGDALSRLSPKSSPLITTVHGATTALPSGQNVLEATGSITNPTAAPQPVPSLAATLSGPGGVALRWTIPPPVATLGPGQSAPYTSTVTGFPASATALSVHPQ